MIAIDFGLGRLDGFSEDAIRQIVARWAPLAAGVWQSGEGWMSDIHAHWFDDIEQGFSPRYCGADIEERHLPVLVLDSLASSGKEPRQIWSLLCIADDLAARRERIARG